MDRQKLPPPVSTKITRKLASESTEHNSLLNFYSSISTDETGAPKRWKMSSSVQFDEDVIATGKSSPVPNRGTPSRDSSTERKSRPGPKRGGKDKDSIDNASSRESSLEGKDKGKAAADSKRDSSSENSKVKKVEEAMKKVDVLDKAKFYGSKVNGDTPKPKRGRPKSLDLSSKQINGEDDSFKSPDPLTPCNIAVKRRKGRPKETPPTLVAENPVEPQELPEPQLIATSSMTQTDFENEEVEADIEDNVEVVVKRKRGRPRLKMGEIPKGRPGTVTKMLGHQKRLKGQRLVSKLKKKRGRKPKIQTLQGDSKISPHLSGPSVVVKKRIGRPPGAKNKATILKEQMLAKQMENQLKMDKERSDDETLTLSATEIPATDVTLTSYSEDINLSSDILKIVPNDQKNKAFGVREGGIKSLGKLKKETLDMQKVRKKRILNSYAANSDVSRSLDHLPKNDLRRYLQMKLIERLNGNRTTSHTMLKNLSDTEEKKSEIDEYSEDESLPAPDPMRDSDIQNLSALVEQKRVRSESDASTEQRRSLSRSRKSSVDLSKFSDNESISSELSTNSFNASKRIFVLGEDNAESDDTIRTRQRVEIVPGKTRKRTLSGEFDLVDEYQLRKEKKLARLSGGSTVPFDIKIDQLQARSEKTPVVSPVKRKQKTSPKIIAIKQRLEAKRECSSPFVSELRKRLLKQSPFLSRMRRKKKHLVDKRNMLDKDFSVIDTHMIHPDTVESEEKEIQEKLIEPSIIDNNSEIEKQCVISAKMKVGNKLSVEAEIHYDDDESKVDSYQNEVKHELANDANTIGVDDKPLTIENMIHEILMKLVDNVILTCEPDLKENEVFSLEKTNDDKSVIKANLKDILSVPVKRKAGRPRKIKKHFGRIKKSVETVKVTTGARRGRKPKSAQPKESPESIIVRKFELRQKISRSPLDNIALKQSIEESEYYKNEVQRANRKESKLKSKRVYAPVVEEYSLLPFESSETSTEFYQTEAETESEMSDFGFDSSTEPRTLEDYIIECKPCSVIVTDFIKQLQLAQQKNTDSMDEDSLLETEDSGDDSVEHPKGEDRKKSETVGTDASESKTVTNNVVKDKLTGIYKEKMLPDYSSRINLSSLSSPKQDEKSSETSDRVNSADTNAFSTPKTLKIKTPQSKKKTSSPRAKKSTPEHQTARKTVPPLKIKLKGGSWGKTYMVESSHTFDSRLSSHCVQKPLKKKKSKSSSKSGSDSDRGNKVHHHHHHRKKRNKSPLVGQISSFGEKKSKPTAIVAASPAVKQSPLPKGAYEATFLEFIQNKEKDDASLPLPGKAKPFYEISKFKEYKVDTEGNLMVTASCFSQTDTSSTPSITESKSQASLYNSLSKNSTSVVKSSMSDSVQKSLENCHEDNQKKDNQLFIGVIGPRSNLHYFCSVCEGEVHKTDDLVLKHFARVHPGKPIMYRRVAGEANQKDKSQHGSVFERVHGSVVIGDTSKTVSAIENRALKSGLIEGDQSLIPSQANGPSLSSSNRLVHPLDDNKRVPEREDDEESDSGSLNLKIVEVVSLKDQLHALDPEDPTQQEKQPGVKINTQGISPANTVYTPELKIPHIPRSTSSFPGSQEKSQLSSQRNDRAVSSLTSARKTPGLIKPGRLCNTFKCETCNVHAPVLAAMVAHLRNTHTEIPRLFQCPYCRNEEAETEAQIHQHIRKLHPTDNPNPPVALSERAKRNLRTLSVRVPDNKANDTSFLEKDIYMCLNCKVHMPSLEAIYDHLEQVHTEVFVFVCSSCKVFKSKSEQDVIQHIESEPRCNQNQEKNVSLAIDGNQFIRVPCLIKDKNKTRESRLQQQKVSQNTTQTSVGKPITSQNNTQPSSIVQALHNQPFTGTQFLRPGLPMQQIFPSPYGQILTPPIVPQQPQNQLIPVALSQTPLVLSTVVSTVSHTASGIAVSSSTSTLTVSSQAPVSSGLPISLVKPSVSSAPSKPPAPTGAKKRKNLLESIQHIKMQKQLEQQAKLESEKAAASVLGPLATSSATAVTESSVNSQAPPPLIRGPPPLIRFDQLNQVPPAVVASAQSGVIPQQTVKQLISVSKSDATKLVGPPRQIQSSLFDTSDPDAFKPVQRVPVLNVPSVPRSARIPTQASSAIGVSQKSITSGSAPLDLSKTTPTNSPASTPPAQDKAAPQKTPEISNPELYNVFNLKPSTQAQLPKQALQNKGAVHQLPPKAPAPPQPVRPNASNTLAYRPQQPHIATTQVPQVINMPVGMLNNIVVTMPSFQVVQGMPTQYIRMSGTQLISSPAGPVSVAVAMPNTQAPRPVLTSQQTPFQQPMNVNLPIFKCPYCPKLIPLTFNQVQPHIESQHPGCSVVLMPIENKKQS